MNIPKLQDIYLIYSRLSKKERAIAYVAGIFILLAVLDRLIISPVYSTMKSLDDEIRARKAGIGKSMRILAQKDRIASEIAKYTAFLNLQSGRSEEDEMNATMKKIEIMADRSSVYLIDMKPSAVKDIGVMKKFIINLNCESQMQQLADFMYKIENANELLTVDKYEIAPKAKESSVARCSMVVSKVAQP